MTSRGTYQERYRSVPGSINGRNNRKRNSILPEPDHGPRNSKVNSLPNSISGRRRTRKKEKNSDDENFQFRDGVSIV